jgi:hypothetical protein
MCVARSTYEYTVAKTRSNNSIWDPFVTASTMDNPPSLLICTGCCSSGVSARTRMYSSMYLDFRDGSLLVCAVKRETRLFKRPSRLQPTHVNVAHTMAVDSQVCETEIRKGTA